MDFLGNVIGDAVADALVDKAGKKLRRVLGGRGPAGEGRACALKVISGSQDGLSQHWRLAAAQFAPGVLGFTRRGTAVSPITVLGARETTDRVTIHPLGACLIAQLQTPTATLALAMPGGRLTLAVQDLTPGR